MEALQSKRLNDFGKKGWAIILFTLSSPVCLMTP